ncbi:hypothetical protein BDU57DRAFT_552202 [Ampelomyces quisqualis]|uniref:Nuclear fusion protein KAR5 n=1 Tax=Ampelomyces quisqualis TaxID=50730 RepID=A0A6A5Q9F7_AMPQU|nr:hypothetical protein BDU57DRAFT_552202 [Ampelomyces quisqualis]
MKSTSGATGSAALALFIPLSIATSPLYFPPADAGPTLDVGTLFQHTASRNQRVITQAVDFVVSMQNAPTCTRMAASHLMSECKLLEHAPDFAKSRPEAYLDNVKTEYAAKLAVCELLSAQPNNPVPPANCDILVPTSRACNKGGTWWYSRPETTVNEKQCYPEIKEYQYAQCLKTLQSSPQYWTSFSNARQNAVVMCQASRDAIERENHLETFKNLTQVMDAVSSVMKKSTEEYETLIRDQKQFTDEVREAQDRLKEDVHAVQEKALATVGTLDNKFHSFMETSMSELVTALADNRSNEIARIRQEMQSFSGDLMTESAQFARFFNDQLQAHHEQALMSLQANHVAQVDSYNVLAGRMDNMQDIAERTSDAANASLNKIVSFEQRLVNLSDQADHIAQGFAFFSALPHLLSSLIRGTVASMGVGFVFFILCKISKGLATYAAGACSSAYLLHHFGLYKWLGSLSQQAASDQNQPWISFMTSLSSTQQAAGLIMVLWLATIPVGCLNIYLGTVIGKAVSRLLESYWIRQYTNDGGLGFLPSIEIPAPRTSHKPSTHTSPSYPPNPSPFIQA